MKKSTAVIICVLLAAKLFAQDCTNYVYLQKGKTIESTAYNQAGQIMRKTVDYISDVTTSGGTTSATVSSESFDKNGVSKGKRNLSSKCNGGTFSLDMSSSSPQMGNATMKTTYMEYPANMKVGDHFADVETQLQMNMGARTMNITAKITDRTVVDKESVTTPAGTWEALKITYKTTTSMQGSTMAPQTMETTQWFVPNFGIVQFQVGMFTVKLTSVH